MAMRGILSLDIGSSACKAVLFSEGGVQLTTGRGAYQRHYFDNQILVEQEPSELWEGVVASIQEVILNKPPEVNISAISLTAQVSSHMLVDRTNLPLTRIISWADTRAIDQAKRMESAFSREELLQCLGADLPSGAWWPIPKLKWWRENTPDLLDKARYIVQPKEWILWKLTGEWMSESSSLRGLIHQASGLPAAQLLDWAEASPELIPPIGEPYQIGGRLMPAAANQIGLVSHLPVVLGWNDLHAAILGSCCGKVEGSAFDITGTSEQIGICLRGAQPLAQQAGGLMHIPFRKGLDVIYGVTSGGGQALKWYAEQIDQWEEHQQQIPINFERLSSQAELTRAAASGLLFLPYLNGERSPWWNPEARGVFFGLSYSHSRPDLARAVMEGVCFALRSITERLPFTPASMVIAGGASESEVWNQMKANILQIPMLRTQTSEAGCLGAAILAAYALGSYSSIEEAGVNMVKVEKEYVPEASAREIYDAAYGNFIDLYETLAPLFHKTAIKRSKK
jgi:xylulokinase